MAACSRRHRLAIRRWSCRYSGRSTGTSTHRAARTVPAASAAPADERGRQRAGGVDSPALQVSSVGGNEVVVLLLLEKNIDVNAQGRHYRSALQVASAPACDHNGAVRLLQESQCQGP